MSLILKSQCLFLFSLLYVASCSASDTYICPATVRLASGVVVAEDIPAGSESLVSSAIIRLSGNNLYDGPPIEGAVLMPTSTKASTATWVLSDKHPQGIWMSCDYAEGLVKLVKRAADSVTSCVATTKITKPQNTLETRFACK
jgi:hypothetical protein